MSVGDIRQRICSVVAMHRFSGRQYRSGIRSMPIIIMLCMQCLEEMIDVKSQIDVKCQIDGNKE